MVALILLLNLNAAEASPSMAWCHQLLASARASIETDRSSPSPLPAFGEPVFMAGDPVDEYARREMPSILREYFPALDTRDLAASTFRLALPSDVVQRPNSRVLKTWSPGSTLMSFGDQPQIVRAPGPAARRVIDGSVAARQTTDHHPHERYVVDYFDGSKTASISRIAHSRHPVEIGGLEVLAATVEHLLSFYADSADLSGAQSGLLRLTHEHPMYEGQLETPDGGIVKIESHLSQGDLDAARVVSKALPGIAFAMSAVSSGGIEYISVFRNGEDVTAESLALILGADAALSR